MGGPSAPIEPERSVESMIKVVSRIKLSDSGKFLNYDGAKLAW
jgi:hypothetical protein